MSTEKQSKTSFRRIAWVGGALLTVLLLAAAAERKREMAVAATLVEVEPLPAGALLIDSADIIRLIERSMGSSLDEQLAGNIDADRIERALEEDPFVKNAEVALLANSTIKVNIEQRDPILRIMDHAGAQYYIDVDGARIPLSRHFTARTLVATGQVPPHTPEFLQKKRHVLKDLYQLTIFLREDPFWNALIEQVHVNGRGELLLVPKIGDHVVMLGKWGAAVEDKFSRLKIFYQEAMSREGWQKYRMLDLRYRGQVVCEKR
jgi:cell division protein FtsQ